MASNQGHYVGSLPNDYATLARFAHDDHDIQDEENNLTEDEEGASSANEVDRRVSFRAQSPRRSSFPSSYIIPPPATIPSMNFKSSMPDKDPVVENGATEHTPLLGPLVPRIEEAEHGNEDHTKSNTTMFWEEIRILSKYTLPVFG